MDCPIARISILKTLPFPRFLTPSRLFREYSGFTLLFLRHLNCGRSRSDGFFKTSGTRCIVHDHFPRRSCALFVLLEAFFLAILQVLVYAGAVMVLFLFIIMLLDVGPEGGKASRIKVVSGLAGSVAAGLLVILVLNFVLQTGFESNRQIWPAIDESSMVTGQNLVFSTAVKNFGFGLFTKYMLPLQVSGFLLLAAMVGVIILSKKSVAEES